jgi:hypothetical protein
MHDPETTENDESRDPESFDHMPTTGPNSREIIEKSFNSPKKEHLDDE